MKASNPRTYSRKRKDTAEAKFDALFRSSQTTIEIEGGDVKKRKTRNIADLVPESNTSGKELCTAKPNGSPMKTFKRGSQESAAAKFDSLFSTSPTKKSEFKKSGNLSQSPEITRTGYASIGSKNSKYDDLFKKHEKSASEKFDALFGDSDIPVKNSTLSQKRKDPTLPPVSNSGNPDYDNYFGFEVAEGANSPLRVDTSAQQSPKKVYLNTQSPTKTSDIITATSVKTSDGKLLLNIQRGGKKTPDTSSSKSVKTPDFLKSAHSKCSLSTEAPSLNNPYNDKFNPVSSPTTTGNEKTAGFTKTRDSSRCTKTQKPPQLHSTNISKNSSRKFSKVLASSTSKQNTPSKASYNSRPWLPDSEDSEKRPSANSDTQSLSQPLPASDVSLDIVPKLTKSITWPEKIGESIVTSIKCDKNAKEYYTVVRHVKNYQNCLEEGEAQEFEDEVEYILDGVQPSQPTAIRCLSVTNLAGKCQQHNFRLYLRAHNICTKVFQHLQDAIDNKCLALASAALLFMLSRDRQMEINKMTLQLLLRLLDPLDREPSKTNGIDKSGAEKETSKPKYRIFKSKAKPPDDAEETKNWKDVQDKVKQLIKSCGDSLLSTEDCTTKRLASEALLRFTARRTAEWFREEVRLKGGLDHIILLVNTKVDVLVPSTNVTSSYERILSLLERIMKVLENAIIRSPRNSMYLVTHQRALLLRKLAKLLQMCQTWLKHHPGQNQPPPALGSGDPPAPEVDRTYLVLRNSVVQIIKLLVNVSNDSEWVSTKVGDQDSLLPSIVHCVLTVPAFLEESHRYELVLLSLSLLVNLVEVSAKNRIILMKMEIPLSPVECGAGDAPQLIPVVEALVRLFYERESSARENEVLGEEGVKKAVEAKKGIMGSKESDTESLQGSQRSDFKTEHKDGRWVESEDGMEWVPADDVDDESLAGSQESVRSKNPEVALTAEEKSEMKQTLNKANEHMEHCIVAAYVALVLGCLIHGNRSNATSIRRHLRGDDDFQPMIGMLKKFLTFMKMTAGMSPKGEKTLTQIIEDLEEENLATQA